MWVFTVLVWVIIRLAVLSILLSEWYTRQTEPLEDGSDSVRARERTARDDKWKRGVNRSEGIPPAEHHATEWPWAKGQFPFPIFIPTVLCTCTCVLWLFIETPLGTIYFSALVSVQFWHFSALINSGLGLIQFLPPPPPSLICVADSGWMSQSRHVYARLGTDSEQNQIPQRIRVRVSYLE